ncbi:hypothetical protein [Rhodopirellula sp. MGV]|uniref:hypothetical protein n=1 Tax=Rhodopirellula sp. MGV TaxID=2023130 RepID=UPI000B96AF0D|nr:hypothetical protein [Rhodopirellula sp. MGV]OYP38156.1 hypothetical protein CGZ80_02700 [Rhodopirellula sp. MGV]PNY38496.1 hypothetical protein C2E31_00760 [Rhodopirellula baltica]
MKINSSFLGSQGSGPEDNSDGSRYSEVKDAMFRNAYYLDWGTKGDPPLPTYEVTLGRVIRGILPGALPWLFKQAAKRAVDSNADLRWGENQQGFRRLLHPNGICLFGRWEIDAESEYSGYFEQGSNALIVARYSTCCTETRRGFTRSLSLVGKLFPTTFPDHPEPLRTANFYTQEDIGGTNTVYINEAELRNAPDVTPWRRGLALPILLLSGIVFKVVDREPAIRQLHTIAELGKPEGESTRAPKFMRLTVSQDQPYIRGDDIDFRDEILEQLYDRGNSNPSGRKLVFNIEVTDDGVRHGFLKQRWQFRGWKHIGRIEFTEAVASYNADFVVHFPHPKWRTDRNDPKTQLRPTR